MSVEIILVQDGVVVGECLGEAGQAGRGDLLQGGLVRLVTNAAHVDCHSVVGVVHRRSTGRPMSSTTTQQRNVTASVVTIEIVFK